MPKIPEICPKDLFTSLEIWNPSYWEDLFKKDHPKTYGVIMPHPETKEHLGFIDPGTVEVMRRLPVYAGTKNPADLAYTILYDTKNMDENLPASLYFHLSDVWRCRMWGTEYVSPVSYTCDRIFREIYTQNILKPLNDCIVTNDFVYFSEQDLPNKYTQTHILKNLDVDLWDLLCVHDLIAYGSTKYITKQYFYKHHFLTGLKNNQRDVSTLRKLYTHVHYHGWSRLSNFQWFTNLRTLLAILGLTTHNLNYAIRENNA